MGTVMVEMTRLARAPLAVILAGCASTNVDVAPATAEARAARQLEVALAEAPFPVRLPVLAGYTLTNVDFVSEPDDPTGHRFSLDVRFAGPSGAAVHVFQTNVSPEAMGDTDPVALPLGRQVSVAGEVWTAVTLPNGDGTASVQLARRIGEVTLSLDAPSAELARAAAEALAPASS